MEGIIISSYKYRQNVHDAQEQVTCAPNHLHNQGWKIGGAKRSPTAECPGLYPRENFAELTLKNFGKRPIL